MRTKTIDTTRATDEFLTRVFFSETLSGRPLATPTSMAVAMRKYKPIKRTEMLEILKFNCILTFYLIQRENIFIYLFF